MSPRSPTVLLFPLLAALLGACSRSRPPRPGPPNVLVLYVDDMGYADLGRTGNPLAPTPNIDALAREGVFFGNGYSTACVCSPARVALLTGRYQNRFGFEANVSTIPRPVEALDPSVKTMADRLQELGYTTGVIGKWHIGSAAPELLPNARGFDEFYGILPHEIAGKWKEPIPVWRNGQQVPVPENHMIAFGDEAESFIERHADTPWFLFCAFTAVHVPYEVPKELQQRFKDHPRSAHQAMLALLDDVVGGIMEVLRDENLDESTLVFFASDNGAPFSGGDNGPFSGHKFSLAEGGIRTPVIVRWKGHLPSGVERPDMVNQLDFMPTAFAAAGAPAPAAWELDGVDLLPILRGETDAPLDRPLFWRFGVQYAVREGPWKLVKIGLEEPVRLFDVERDPGETDDRFAAEPERVAHLQGLWDAWNAGNRKPRWDDLRWNRLPEPAAQAGTK